MFHMVLYLEPYFLNIYLNDLFFILDETNVCNYADDTGLHACGKDLNEVKTPGA